MKKTKPKLRWRRDRYGGSYRFYGDGRYDYGYVFQCINGGLSHGKWIANGKDHHSQHRLMKHAQRAVERSFR